MAKPDFWSNQKNAAGTSQEASDIKEVMEEWDEINKEVFSLGEMMELAENDENLAKELEEKLASLERRIGKEEK